MRQIAPQMDTASGGLREADPVFGPSDPATDYVPVTPGASALANGACRAILCSENGFLNLTPVDGAVREDIPVFAGYNPLSALVIDQPTTGSAPGTVVALY